MLSQRIDRHLEVIATTAKTAGKSLELGHAQDIVPVADVETLLNHIIRTANECRKLVEKGWLQAMLGEVEKEDNGETFPV